MNLFNIQEKRHSNIYDEVLRKYCIRCYFCKFIHLMAYVEFSVFQSRHVDMLKVMWIFITKLRFDMKLRIQFLILSSFTGKNKWKNYTKRNDDANTFKSYRIWIIDDTQTILRHRKSHQFHWIVMMISARSTIMHQTHQTIQKPSVVLCTTSRDKHLGLWISNRI